MERTMEKWEIADCVTGGGGYYLILYGGHTADGVTTISDPLTTCEDVDKAIAELTGMLNKTGERVKAKIRRKEQG